MGIAENIAIIENIDNTEIDKLLQYLVQVVDLSDAGYDITLQVGSKFISGMLVSKKTYFIQNFNNFQEFGESLNNPILTGLQETFDTFAQKEKEWIDLALEGDVSSESDLKKKPHALHLKNVKIYNNSFAQYSGIPLLRVKLSSVDSFFIGVPTDS